MGIESEEHALESNTKMLGLRTRLTRWSWLGLAWMWSIGAICFCVAYHLPEPQGVDTINVGGHAYFGRIGRPPALTLLQRDRISFELIAIALAAVLVVSTVELAARTYRRSELPGMGAIITGGCLVAFSAFGLVLGLLGLGTVGLFTIFSGFPMRGTYAPPKM